MSATLTSTIANDLRERARGGDGGLSPAELTLPRLAARYGVSLTPVRRAVAVLVEEGTLQRSENGRLSLPPSPPAGRHTPAAGAPTPEPAQRDWEARLVGEIVAHSLRGGAPYLREEAVALNHGVGRTVLRQTFSRLAGKGLLEHVPRCGWRVRPFDERDMADYLAVRESLELTALDLALPRLVPADLERMRAANTPPAPGAPAPLDNRLHDYWIERSGNAYIRDFFDRYGPYYTALFDFAAPEAHRMDEMAAQHRAILTALLEGDAERAKAELTGHIRSQRPVVARLMRRLAGREG
jgi:DNA-binding GntR family transcriptional regulator